MNKAQSMSTTVVSSADTFKRLIIKKNFDEGRARIQCFVAGYRYYDGEIVIDVLKRREKLEVVHEFHNPYDPNAVAVYTYDGMQLGYVPRVIAPLIASRIDNNEPVYASIYKINRKHYHDPYVRIEIAIEIPL